MPQQKTPATLASEGAVLVGLLSVFQTMFEPTTAVLFALVAYVIVAKS